MPEHLRWLPALVLFESFDGEWHRYLDALYEHFRADFLQTKPRFPRKPLQLRFNPKHDSKECCFWHIISEGPEEADRNPDFRRCERIKWPRPMIESFQGDRTRYWKNTRPTSRGPASNIVIATSEFEYVTIIEERTDYVLFKTAYHVEQPHRRNKLRKEWERFWEDQKKTGVAR